MIPNTYIIPFLLLISRYHLETFESRWFKDQTELRAPRKDEINPASTFGYQEDTKGEKWWWIQLYISNEMGVMVVYTVRVIYQKREDEKIHVMVVAV